MNELLPISYARLSREQGPDWRKQAAMAQLELLMERERRTQRLGQILSLIAVLGLTLLAARAAAAFDIPMISALIKTERVAIIAQVISLIAIIYTASLLWLRRRTTLQNEMRLLSLEIEAFELDERRSDA